MAVTTGSADPLSLLLVNLKLNKKEKVLRGRLTSDPNVQISEGEVVPSSADMIRFLVKLEKDAFFEVFRPSNGENSEYILTEDECERFYVNFHPSENSKKYELVIHPVGNIHGDGISGGRAFLLNDPAPYDYENDYFKCKFLLAHKVTRHNQLGKHVRIMGKEPANYLKGKKRRWELRVQGRFKDSLPEWAYEKSHCWIGIEAADPVTGTGGWLQSMIKGLFFSMVNVYNAAVGGGSYDNMRIFEGTNENPRPSMFWPVSSLHGIAVETYDADAPIGNTAAVESTTNGNGKRSSVKGDYRFPGSKLNIVDFSNPDGLIDSKEDMKSRNNRLADSLARVNPEQIYTLIDWTQYADIVEWCVMNLKGMPFKSVELKSFIGTKFDLVAFAEKPGDGTEDANGSSGTASAACFRSGHHSGATGPLDNIMRKDRFDLFRVRFSLEEAKEEEGYESAEDNA